MFETYERICKVLVTYPSLDFKDTKLIIRKNKEQQFSSEYFGQENNVNIRYIYDILEIGNISISSILESNDDVEKLVLRSMKNKSDLLLITTFLKDVCGNSYESYLQSIVNKYDESLLNK